MELLKTNHCCCCIDLRTGGLILGYLLAFSGIYGIFSGLMNGPAYILPNLVAVALSGCWIYGILENKSSWLLLYVVLRMIEMCLLICAWIIVVVLLLLSPTDDTNVGQYIRQNFDYLLFAAYLFGPITALEWHYTSVAYSLYKNIKTEEEQNLCDPSVLYTPPTPITEQLYPVVKV